MRILLPVLCCAVLAACVDGTPVGAEGRPTPGVDRREAGGVSMKLEREVLSSHIPNRIASDNFMVKWGDDCNAEPACRPAPTRAEMVTVSQALESSWSLFIDQMRYPVPESTRTHTLNYYVIGSQLDLPTGFDGGPGPGGYTNWDTCPGHNICQPSDPSSMPAIFAGPAIRQGPAIGAMTAHEFFHTIQLSTGAFLPAMAAKWTSSWHMEATAQWAASRAFPDQLLDPTTVVHVAGVDKHVSLLPNYAFRPHLSLLNTHENHAYGAFIFFQYLTEHEADDSLVLELWTQSHSLERPLRTLERLLARRGVNLGEAFTRFAAHNATWDYAEGARYKAILAGATHPALDESIAIELPSPRGSGAWVQPAAHRHPERFGYNLLRLQNPAPGRLSFGFRGALNGSLGTPAQYGLMLLVQFSNGSRVYLPLPVHDGVSDIEGELNPAPPLTMTALYVVVAAWSPPMVYGAPNPYYGAGEQFPYQVRLSLQ